MAPQTRRPSIANYIPFDPDYVNSRRHVFPHASSGRHLLRCRAAELVAEGIFIKPSKQYLVDPEAMDQWLLELFKSGQTIKSQGPHKP